MTKRQLLPDRLWLCVLMLYGVIIIGMNLNFSSVFHDEAINIFMGRQVILGQDCSLCAQNTGSVAVHPVLAAFGDAAWGLRGARGISMFFGLALAMVLYFTGSALFSERHGLLSAILFLFSGTAVYLSKLATYDMAGAFFLALSFFIILRASQVKSGFLRYVLLMTGALVLFVAAITKYTIFIYVLPLMIYALWRHSFVRGLVFFVLPFAVCFGMYWNYALAPVWGTLSGSMSGPYKEGLLPAMTVAERIFRWLGLPYLLAAFGIFADKGRGRALVAILLSTPIVFIHMLSGDARSVDKNVIFALVFLVPAMAVGVESMGKLFSSDTHLSWVKPLFISLIVVVIWVFGIYDLRWLQKQYPDVSEVVQFYRQYGYDGMTVVVDSAVGTPDYIYRYSLEDRFPKARFVSMSYLSPTKQGEILRVDSPDFLMCDEFYGARSLRDAARMYVAGDYFLLKNFTLQLSWGTQDVKIYKRRLGI